MHIAEREIFMSTTLEAIYENGIFKPISTIPVKLREHERVRIIIETESILEYAKSERINIPAEDVKALIENEENDWLEG
jgi:predicted DNA-binding antitoxin AbrB/MazE fold protein